MQNSPTPQSLKKRKSERVRPLLRFRLNQNQFGKSTLWVVVAIGSMVTAGQEVGPHQLVAGMPAKFKKTLSEAPNEKIQKPLRDYHELSKQYREMFG